MKKIIKTVYDGVMKVLKLVILAYGALSAPWVYMWIKGNALGLQITLGMMGITL